MGTGRVTAHIRYSIDSESAILTCALDDVVLLYHAPSGQTHIVVPPVPQLLDALRESSPATASDLLERLSRNYDLGPADAALGEIKAHLVELAALGLVRPA